MSYDIIQLVTRSDTIGGVHNHIIDIISFTKKNNLKTLVLCGNSKEKKFIKRLEELNFDYEIVPSLKANINLIYDLKTIFELFILFKKNKPKLICLHSSKSGILGRLVSSFLRIPCIFTVHGWSFSIRTNFLVRTIYFVLEYILQFFCDHIITDSFEDKKIASKKFFFTDKISSIPNSSSFLSQPPKNKNDQVNFNYSNNELNFLTIARFDHQKDHSTLFKGLALLPKEIKWKMFCVGDGPLFEKTKDYVKKLNLESKIIFTGFQKNLEVFYKKADVYLLITNWEGMPITLLDAMNFSLPIIVTNVGGCSDVVSHGYNGYLIPKNSEKHLSYFLSSLSKKYKLRIEMGNQSKYLFNRLFSIEFFHKKTFDLYKKYIFKKS